VFSAVLKTRTAINRQNAAERGEKRYQLFPGGPASSRSGDSSVRHRWVFFLCTQPGNPLRQPWWEGEKRRRKTSLGLLLWFCFGFEGTCALRAMPAVVLQPRDLPLGLRKEKNAVFHGKRACTKRSPGLVGLKAKLRPWRFLRAFGGCWWSCPVARCHLVSPAGTAFGDFLSQVQFWDFFFQFRNPFLFIYFFKERNLKNEAGSFCFGLRHSPSSPVVNPARLTWYNIQYR